MATKWVSRLNPASWLLRRRPREAVVVPGGRHEYSTPAEYVSTSQDDYTAADRPANDDSLEFFAEAPDRDSFEPDMFQMSPASSGEYPFPRTVALEYDSVRSKMRIEYFSGGTYEYDDVTLAMWSAISSAQSTGRWINRNLLPLRQGIKV